MCAVACREGVKPREIRPEAVVNDAGLLVTEQRLQAPHGALRGSVQNARDGGRVRVCVALPERLQHRLHKIDMQVSFARRNCLPRLQDDAQRLRRQDTRRVAQVAAGKCVPGLGFGNARRGKMREALKSGDGIFCAFSIDAVGVDVQKRRENR